MRKYTQNVNDFVFISNWLISNRAEILPKLSYSKRPSTENLTTLSNFDEQYRSFCF